MFGRCVTISVDIYYQSRDQSDADGREFPKYEIRNSNGREYRQRFHLFEDRQDLRAIHPSMVRKYSDLLRGSATGDGGRRRGEKERAESLFSQSRGGLGPWIDTIKILYPRPCPNGWCREIQSKLSDTLSRRQRAAASPLEYWCVALSLSNRMGFAQKSG